MTVLMIPKTKVILRGIEELQIEPNVNVQTDPTDTNNVDMSLVPSNIPISNVFDVLNNVNIKHLVTPDLQSTNYDINDPMDSNNVDMSLVPSTSNVFDDLNNITIKNSVTPDLQSINYDINSDFLLQNLINENSNNLMEIIGDIDDGTNIFNNPDTNMMDIDDK
ncbi:unnamed protein product [Macrosiphum euphorbiae]|uniref:Uncharacterized protein n=1 Tax=Macrosiphum euphorbiae TaxID=13131 RepID=A0AAV0WMV2_9HEMI|nr:unnamed protein product [Macrosiphum euphorbiae]